MRPFYVFVGVSIFLACCSAGYCSNTTGHVKIGLTKEKMAGDETRAPSVRTEIYFSYRAVKTLGLNHNFYGKVDTWAGTRNHSLTFRPYRTIYTVGWKIDTGAMFIGIEHYCSHAVDASWSKKVWEDNAWVGVVNILYIGMVW